MAVERHQLVGAATGGQRSYWVADTAAETVTGAVEGDIKYAKDTDSLYSYDGATWDAVGSSTGTGRFGTGYDGSVTLDGTSQVSWATLSGSTYTLFRDVHCTDLTISSGITVRPLGCAIFVTGTLDNSGTIEWNGNAASGATAGTAETGVVRYAATLAGAAGTTNTAGSGAAATAAAADRGLSPGKGGAGGPGDTGRTGGLGGTVDPPSVQAGGPLQWDSVVAGFPMLIDVTTASRNQPQFGTGGGAGAGATSGVSGGGGAGGGVIIIAAKTITNQASGIISAKGGAGGNGSGTGPVGGGGGGGGGNIYLIYDSYTNSGSVTVDGGAGGTGSGTTDLTSGALPSTDQVTASDTDAAYYTATIGLNNQGTVEFLTIVNTKSGGGDIPTSVTRKSGFVTPDQFLMENGGYTQLATVVNGDQRMTLYWTRAPMNSGDGGYATVAVEFPATQTSCSIRSTAWAGGSQTADITIQEVQTGTATAATTLSINLAGPVIGGYEIIWTAVQANVTISKEAAWTANLQAGAHAAPAGNNRGAYFRGGTDTTAAMTTAANQNWVGIAVDIRSGSGSGEKGFPGRIVQIPA